MFLNENRKNEYNCLMLYCKKPEIIKKLHEQIDKDDLYEEEGEEFGLEKESHITLLYGLLPKVNWDDLKEYLESIDKFNIISPKISTFENDKYEVLKLDIKCPLLHTINKKLTENLPYETDFPKYEPHMTVAYLKKGKSDKYIKPMLDKIEKITPTEYVYSKTDNTKERYKNIN